MVDSPGERDRPAVGNFNLTQALARVLPVMVHPGGYSIRRVPRPCAWPYRPPSLPDGSSPPSATDEVSGEIAERRSLVISGTRTRS